MVDHVTFGTLGSDRSDLTIATQGHQKPITALTAVSADTFVSGSSDGRVLKWSLGEGLPSALHGSTHTNQVTGLAVAGSEVVSTGMDDSARFIDVTKGSFSSSTIAFGAIPKGVASAGDLAVAVLANKAVTIVGNAQKSSVDLKFSASAVAVKPDGSEVAIGGEDNLVHLFKVGGDKSLEDTGKSLNANKGIITALAYSPDGNLLLVGDGQRKIVAYDTASGAVKIDQWVFHTSRVNSVAWSPDGKFAVSGSLDTNVIQWTLDDPFAKSVLKSELEDVVRGMVRLTKPTDLGFAAHRRARRRRQLRCFPRQ